MKLDELKEIVDFMKENDIAELEIEKGGEKVHVKRNTGFVVPAGLPMMASPHPFPTAQMTAGAAAAPGVKEGVIVIEAPMVGTFYRAPAPGAEPYVKEGDVIEKERTLCIIEAMKLMNEIESDVAGKIVAILVENAQPVEFGQPLFHIETTG